MSLPRPSVTIAPHLVATAPVPQSAPAARPAPVYPKRRGHRHGYVREAAIKRGLEVIALRGPAGLTLRGIARDLGIAAPTVMYHFGNLEGLRQAVADEIAARMNPHACMNGSPGAPAPILVEKGLRWAEFAATHPEWYAFAAGVAWRRRPSNPKSGGSRFSPATTCIRTASRILRGSERARAGGGRGDARPSPVNASSPDAAAALYAAIHGLAMARAEGHAGPAAGRSLLLSLAAHLAG